MQMDADGCRLSSIKKAHAALHTSPGRLAASISMQDLRFTIEDFRSKTLTFGWRLHDVYPGKAPEHIDDI